MDIYDHFRIAARVVTNHSTYSPQRQVRIISVPRIKDVVRQKIRSVDTSLPMADAVLEESAQRGFWKMDFDQDDELDIVIVR
ncbi:hypothetical protein [Dyella mobilis]|uniref:Uncharacterized protein n=1 Tax=Dyella mobilis TaxID=1849582 RepID=A0ABS2KBZ8_9GAMM|nr:hypothetical protein [Dyella mobilis]MBM7128707.1 hypothetical protein [Dyella mobilis]GLQ99032.1 hypothetical protein GCM10007863_34520 [Dyella mobilis]